MYLQSLDIHNHRRTCCLQSSTHPSFHPPAAATIPPVRARARPPLSLDLVISAVHWLLLALRLLALGFGLLAPGSFLAHLPIFPHPRPARPPAISCRAPRDPSHWTGLGSISSSRSATGRTARRTCDYPLCCRFCLCSAVAVADAVRALTMSQGSHRLLVEPRLLGLATVRSTPQRNPSYDASQQ